MEGMIELYSDIISRYDIAGFRVDTVKHVNDEFWVEWVPAVLESAPDEFFIFGEVFSSDPIFNSHYTTNLGVPGLLDFITQNALEQYVANGSGADVLAEAFDNDDWFTDADSNASMLVKFFGNHDMGRMGRMVLAANPNARPEVVDESMQLGFDLLFLTRGMPVVYYGDEQGFAGVGGDKSARQTMFPATATEFIDQDTLGSEATVSDDNFDRSHPFYQRIALLNDLRLDHPTLARGAQIVHPPQASVFSVSRVDRDLRIEYLVIANNGPLAIPATIPSLSPDTSFVFLLGGEGGAISDSEGNVKIEVGARVHRCAGRREADGSCRPSSNHPTRPAGGERRDPDRPLPPRSQRRRPPLRRGDIRRQRRWRRAADPRHRRRSALPALLEQPGGGDRSFSRDHRHRRRRVGSPYLRFGDRDHGRSVLAAQPPEGCQTGRVAVRRAARTRPVNTSKEDQ